MKNVELNINIMKESQLPHPPQNEEQEFYRMVVCGDIEGIKQLHSKYSDCDSGGNEKGQLSQNPVRNEIYHLVANCTIITRKCIAAGMPQEDAFSLSDMFIRRADLCLTKEAVQSVNDDMALTFAKRMNRINKLNGINCSKGVSFAIRYISDNLYTKLSVDDIAEKAGYQRSYFSKLFHHEIGITVTDYILKQKIEAAKSLIKGEIPLSQISEMLGFSSQSHFCSRFKQLCGITPGEYREYREFSAE